MNRVETYFGYRPALKVLVGTVVLGVALSYQSCAPMERDGGSSNFSSLGTVDETCTNAAPFQATLPQRITKNEYPRVINSLFGIPNATTQAFISTWGDDPKGVIGYASEAIHHNLSPFIIEEYWQASEQVANAVIVNATSPFLTCTGTFACAETLVRPVMRKAYRRSPTSEEITVVRNLFNDIQGVPFENKMRLLLRYVLVSPQFIFRTFEKPADGQEIVPLTGLELASRLSFFIWGTVPDEALLLKGESGALLEKDVLQVEIKRMLADARSTYLVYSFFHKWLQTDQIITKTLDTTVFPNWNNALKVAMLNESAQLYRDIVANDKDIIKIIDADYSFLNAPLANLYDINGTFTADNYVKTSLNNQRRGIMSHGSILALTSADDHTTPVVRGKFVLERLLCSSPPPPPDNIPPLPEDDLGNLNGESRIRERLANHQKQGSSCFACHSSMDPIGLGFENYNAMGGFRDAYIDGVSVNAKGKLPSGEGFDNLMDLVPILAEDQRFGACFVGHVASFATGLDRTSKAYGCYNKVIAKKSVGKEFKLSDAIIEITSSPEFLFRKSAE